MVKVALIKHLSFQESPEGLLSKIDAASRESDIVLGPEYSLFQSRNRLNTPEERMKLTEELGKISSRTGALIVPGTLPYETENGVQMACPVFNSGKFVGYAIKKSDMGDSAILKGMGKTRIGARSEEADFLIEAKGKNIRVYICGDQGRYNFTPGEIELVTAYDNSPGCHIHPSTRTVPRRVFVSDGSLGKTKGFLYNESGEVKPMPIRKETSKFDVYNVK